MLLWVCSIIDGRKRQIMARTSATHSAATFLSLPCFYVVCDLLQNGRMATWNRFIQYCISKFLSPTEYTAFGNPLLGQESIAFLIGNLKTYC